MDPTGGVETQTWLGRLCRFDGTSSGWWFSNYFFSIIYGIKSLPLTNIFQNGLKPPTSIGKSPKMMIFFNAFLVGKDWP